MCVQYACMLPFVRFYFRPVQMIIIVLEIVYSFRITYYETCLTKPKTKATNDQFKYGKINAERYYE